MLVAALAPVGVELLLDDGELSQAGIDVEEAYSRRNAELIVAVDVDTTLTHYVEEQGELGEAGATILLLGELAYRVGI